MIASALGIYERKEYARKCTVKTVKDKDIVINFFNTNHIQGAVSRYELALGFIKEKSFCKFVYLVNSSLEEMEI